MRMFIILALLSGWLVTELKDFMNLGGGTNLLAFGLLKICFTLFLIAFVIGGIYFPEIVMEGLRSIKEKTPNDLNQAHDNGELERPARKLIHKRNNSE